MGCPLRSRRTAACLSGRARLRPCGRPSRGGGGSCHHRVQEASEGRHAKASERREASGCLCLPRVLFSLISVRINSFLLLYMLPSIEKVKFEKNANGKGQNNFLGPVCTLSLSLAALFILRHATHAIWGSAGSCGRTLHRHRTERGMRPRVSLVMCPRVRPGRASCKMRTFLRASERRRLVTVTQRCQCTLQT